MPHRFEPLIAQLAAAAAAFFAGLAALIDAGAALAMTGIIADRTMLLVCVVGAIGGSFVSMVFFPPRASTGGVLAFKFLASGATSAIFSPFAIHWLQPAPTLEFVLFVSGAVGLCAHSLITVARRAFISRARKMLGDDEPPTDRG